MIKTLDCKYVKMWKFLLEILLKECQKPSGKVGARAKISTRKHFKEKFSWLDRNYQAHFDAG